MAAKSQQDESEKPTPEKPKIEVPLLSQEELAAEVPLDEETAQALSRAGESYTGPVVRVNHREGFQDLIDVVKEDLDPSFVYRWVQKSAKQVSRRKAQGYVIVNPSREVIRNFSGQQVHVEADQTYTEGDLVLMKCPRHIHSHRRAAKEEVSSGRLTAETQNMRHSFMRSARQSGVEAITTREPGRE